MTKTTHFSCKCKTVNSLSTAGHTASVLAARSCHCGRKAAIDNTETCRQLCSNKTYQCTLKLNFMPFHMLKCGSSVDFLQQWQSVNAIHISHTVQNRRWAGVGDGAV